MLLVERADDGTTTVAAYSLDDAVSIQRDAPTRTRLYALGYRASLGELGLRPGAKVVDPLGGPLRTHDTLHVLEEWSRAPLPRLAPRPEVMLDLGGGCLLYGGQDGVIVEWSEATGQCEPLVVGSGDIVFGGARLATGFTVVSSGRAGRVLVSVATKKR